MNIKSNLLSTANIDSQLLTHNLSKLINTGADFADYYLQDNLTESWGIDEGIIKSGSFSWMQGIGLRIVCGEKTYLSHSNGISNDVVNKLLNSIFVESSVENKNLTTSHKTSNTSLHNLYTDFNSIKDVNNIDKIQLLKKIDEMARNKPHVVNLMAGLNLEYDEFVVARSDNRIHSDVRPLIHLSVSIVVDVAGKKERGSGGGGGRYAISYYTDRMLQEYVDRAYKQAMLKLEAVSAPNGQIPIVLGNGWAGVILHEAVGHGLEGDFNRKQSSAFSGKIGAKVASELVSVVDDGTIANLRGSINIDDEGNHSQSNLLIENGILRGYLFDELNAKLMGVSPTGNGRRESYADVPIPRMTNTFMRSGTSNPEDIIASVDYGLYADSFEGGQVDITSGQFVFNASVAWVVENGKLSYPVKGCALVGNGPECLKHITMLGNDSELDGGIGVCGKEGQMVPVGVGQPTMRLDGGLVVGG